MVQPLSGKPTFGAGRVFATANQNNPTPARAFVPQSQSIDFKRKTESLFGEYQMALAVGAGEMDVSGKVEMGKTQPRILSDIMLGDTQASGSYLEADGELVAVAASSPYTGTVVNSATFLFDLGVVNPTTGAILTCVASAPVAGKSYMVTAGVYTFAAGDEGVSYAISYAYSITTTGATIAMNNQPQGLTGQFQAVHVLPWGAQQDIFVFTNCIAGGYSHSLKKSGFGSSSLDYMAFVGTNGSLGTATFADAA